MSAPPAENATEARKVSQSWINHGLAFAALTIWILAAFHDAVSAAVTVWWVSPTYSHCFLIIPISVWLIWDGMDRWRGLHPTMWTGVLWFVPLLVALWWLGELSTINEIQQLAVVGMIQIAAAFAFGPVVYRANLFAALYLFFLIPTGEYLIVPMQQFATRFVDTALNLLQIPHFTQGSLIELTTGRFEIAEACAGLRFLIATITLGVLFAHLMFGRWSKIIVFVLACLGVPLIANGLRCVGIILLAYFTNNKYGAGADHLIYGWGFNIAILLVLFLVGSRFRDPHEEVHDRSTQQQSKPKQNLLMWSGVAALLIAVGPALAAWNQHSASNGKLLGAMTAELYLPGWTESISTGLWRPHFVGADGEVNLSARPTSVPDGRPVDVYVAYFTHSRRLHSIASHASSFWGDSEQAGPPNLSVEIASPLSPIPVHEWVITSPTETRIVWATYWVDDAFTTSIFRVKLFQAKASLMGDPAQAAIALSTVVDGSVEDARHRLAVAMSSLGDLSKRLKSIKAKASGAD